MDGYEVAMDGYECSHGTKKTVDGYVGIGQRGQWMDDVVDNDSYLAKADSGLVVGVVLYGWGRRSQLLLHLCELCGEGLEPLVE